MIPRFCESCGRKPIGYHGRRWCYDCKPGCGGRPLPCKRCHSPDDYWTSGLCRRCHQYAPQLPEPCRDCLAWGARRTQKWLCEACIAWRSWYPSRGRCVACCQQRCLNPVGACRLCWMQTKHLPDAERPSRHTNLDEALTQVLNANRHGQQLSFANMGTSKNGHRARVSSAADCPPSRAGAASSTAGKQLDLLQLDRITLSWQRHDATHPPDPALAAVLDEVARNHARRHGWTLQQMHDVRTAVRVLLVRRGPGPLPIRLSEVRHHLAGQWQLRSVLAILEAAKVFTDDSEPTIQAWFARKVIALPEGMREELNVWFTVLHDGSSAPPRSRARSPITIKNYLTCALPTLTLWASAGHLTLREISRADILAALPAAGTRRAQVGGGLRSIFRTLKAHKVVFINPMTRVHVGNYERRMPLPGDQQHLAEVMANPDPAAALLAALLLFHGLRPLELCSLQLTDVRDGRLYLPDRVIPLAAPVQQRLTRYLDDRHRAWPNSINRHLFVHKLNAGGTHPVQRFYVNGRLGVPARLLRQERIVDEVLATGGDLRRICDFFGVSMGTAEHYASSLNHPDITSSRTEGSP